MLNIGKSIVKTLSVVEDAQVIGSFRDDYTHLSLLETRKRSLRLFVFEGCFFGGGIFFYKY